MILDELNSLCDNLNYKYSINFGGCCFVAFCIATQLEKYGIPYKVILLADDYISSYELRNNFKENDGFGTNDDVGNHYLLQVDNYYINLGNFEINYYYVSKSSYVKPIEIYHVYEDGYWNCTYDRSNNIRIFDKIVKFFKEHEEEAKNFTSCKL